MPIHTNPRYLFSGLVSLRSFVKSAGFISPSSLKTDGGSSSRLAVLWLLGETEHSDKLHSWWAADICSCCFTYRVRYENNCHSALMLKSTLVRLKKSAVGFLDHLLYIRFSSVSILNQSVKVASNGDSCNNFQFSTSLCPIFSTGHFSGIWDLDLLLYMTFPGYGHTGPQQTIWSPGNASF